MKKFEFMKAGERFKIRQRRRNTASYIIFVMSVFLAAALFLVYHSGAMKPISKVVNEFFGIKEFSSNADRYPFSVHFINVGNGDAILVHTDNVNIMVDAGEYTESGTAADYLRHADIDYIDLFIATHTDNDHIGDFAHVSDECEIGEIWISDFCRKDEYQQTDDEKILYKTIQDKNIKVVSPDIGKYNIGDLTVEVLSPDRKYSEDNDNSLVVRIIYDDISVLLMGDAGERAEKNLIFNCTDVKADILKVGHHGSKTAATEDFLKAVSPKYAVISVGDKNKYLPNRDTVDRIENSSAELYRTDVDGNIIIASDGRKIDVFRECE